MILLYQLVSIRNMSRCSQRTQSTEEWWDADGRDERRTKQLNPKMSDRLASVLYASNRGRARHWMQIRHSAG